MLGTLTRMATILLVWIVAGLLLAWGWLPGRWRRFVSVLTSAAGLAFLLVALSSEGLREAPTVGVFLLGTPYATAQASASAGLPYYILTGICLLLGTAGLAVGDDLARGLERHWMATAVALGIGVVAVRAALEKVATPVSITQLFGVVWLAPVVGAFFYLVLRADGRGWRHLAVALLVYAYAVRGLVTLFYYGATALHLGSHYDLSSAVEVVTPWGRTLHFAAGSFRQFSQLVLFPQLVVWPLYTLLSGLVGAMTVRLIASAWPSLPSAPFRSDVPLPTGR